MSTPSSTASVDLNGVLAECIVQPASNSPQYTNDKQTCEIRIKGPYDQLKDVNNIVMQKLSDAVELLPVSTSQNFDFPTPPLSSDWWVTGTSIEQLEAGDHCILTLTCDTRPYNYDPSGADGAFDPYQDTWNLRWESYTVKPAGFCENSPHEDRTLTSMTGPEPLSGTASRQHINYFIEAGKDKAGYSNQIQHYWYRTQDGDFVLNNAEELVLQKVLQDRSALYHYPVLTHTTVKNFTSNLSNILSSNVRYTDTLGEDIDHLVDGVPNGCPYSFPESQSGESWQWIKTGDDLQHVKTKERISFQRTETFMGVISADINFYGNVPFDHSNLSACRWKIGEV